jgi:pimeloyl-ACP methyl ester carboxylesterase
VAAVDHLRATHGLDAINLLGICQGGTFSLCYAALHPDKVRNLITMVTPVDFHTEDNMLGNWARGLDVDLMVDTLGNIPADLMNFCYLTLKPWRLFVQKYVGLVDVLDDREALEDFLRMEKWIFDSPDQAGEAFRQFMKQFYQGNGFVNGGIDIGEREVDLGLVDHAGAEHLRRAGPPGAAVGVEAAEGGWSAPTTTPSCPSAAATSASTSPAARRRKSRRRSTTGSPPARPDAPGDAGFTAGD